MTGPSLPEDAYVAALLADLDCDLDQAQGRALSSIFFGGGTPSLFSAQALGRILEGLERRIGFADDIEITLEANPDDLTADKIKDLAGSPVNRLSVGIQSFNAGELMWMNRAHTPAQALDSLESEE